MIEKEARAKAAAGGQQTIEDLQKRYQHLRDKKVEAETHYRNAQTQLDELKRQAREKYGTDDVSKLEQMLAKMRLENEQQPQPIPGGARSHRRRPGRRRAEFCRGGGRVEMATGRQRCGD